MSNQHQGFYEEVLDAISDLVLVKGPRSRLVWANRAFRDLYGLTNEALAEIIDGDQADPDDTLQYVRDDHRVFATQEKVDIPSERITGADGSTSFWHTIKMPLFRDGEMVYQVGVSRPIVDESSLDVSANEHSMVVASLDALRSLVQALPSAVAMFDASCRFVAWSEAFVELMAPVSEELPLGAAYQEIFEDRLPLIADLDAVMSGEQPPRRIAEFGDSTETSSRRSVEIECRPWFDHHGQVAGSVVVLYDVTDLLRDQALLQQANEELSQFTYRASHDLVAPVSTARGLLDIAADSLRSGDSDDAAKMIDLADAQLKTLNGLIGDLVDLARADASSTEVSAIDLAALVDDLAHLGELPDADQPFELEFALDIPVVVSEPVRLQQILINLLSNASKFADPAEPRRTVTIGSRTTDTGVAIDVSDNGIGIDPAIVDSIFDIFLRGGSQQRGHGLGLYIVLKHVHHLGGSVKVTNLRKPTTFTIELPHDTKQRP